VANSAALAALASGAFPDGTLAFVQTYKAYFELVASTNGALANVRVAASGNAGHLWERIIESPDWLSQATWTIDPTNSTGLASDENTGLNAGAPLLTYSEHARRLGFGTITAPMAITVLAGSQQAGDSPVYNCTVAATANLTFTGALTALFAGTVTTYAAGAAAPSVDDGYTIIDATIPVSWTASGLLADGVLFKRTNGTAAFWWAAKDLGGVAPAAKLRISVPVTATGRAAIALANGDSYQASTLASTILSMRFTQAQGGIINTNVVFNQFIWSQVIERAPSYVQHVNCLETGNFYQGSIFSNPCFKGSNLLWPMGQSPVTHTFGLIRTGAALVVTGGPVSQWNGRLVCQGGAIHPNQSSFQFQADLAIYDVLAGASGLVADYWSVVFFQTGAICGNNNAGNVVVWANKWSQITYLVAALALAGTFTGGTPYSVGGTAFSEANIDAGTANQLATKGNGIYPTT
jgi:hypothetical protein